MLNWEADAAARAALEALAPAGTELDEWEGHTYLTVVGFLFLDTRVLGFPIPLHRSFEEVNLRFYVRHLGPEGWRRGVVFVREWVPRSAVAWVARALYNENYAALPMGHEIGPDTSGSHAASAAYWWRHAHGRGRLSVSVESPPLPVAAGSHEEFITEHYWGYSAQRDGGTREYHVSHPRWNVSPATHAALDDDPRLAWGEALGACLRARPVSAFLADGSEVEVSRGERLGSLRTG